MQDGGGRRGLPPSGAQKGRVSKSQGPAARKKLKTGARSLSPARAEPLGSTTEVGLQEGPRVLCCGDSLTAGYFGSVKAYTPYARELSRRLGVPAEEIGMSGYCSDELVEFMEKPECSDCFQKRAPGLKVQLARRKYSVVVIMAGTNDLALGRSAEEILQDVMTLHRVCHEHGLRTVALPIPESEGLVRARCHGDADEWVAFNEHLEAWAASLPDRVLYVDMASRVPFSEDTDNFAADGLHMSSKGYTVFGGILADLAGPFILDQQRPSPAISPPPLVEVSQVVVEAPQETEPVVDIEPAVETQPA